MENKISFAEFVKNEIVDFNWDDRQLDILFFSFLKNNHSFRLEKFVVGTSLISKEKFFLKQFKKFYDIEPEVIRLETKINFVIQDKEFVDNFYKKESKLKLKNDDERKAFIAGAFIGKGWVSSPSSRTYHLEFRIGNMSHSLNLQESLLALGARSATIIKGKWFVTYIKKSMVLSDLLRAMQAHQAMMLFEDERISRDFTTSVSKMQAIEEYNYQKTHRSSNEHILAIMKLKEKSILTKLTDEKIKLAELRIDKPDFSLSDLQFAFNIDNEREVSKSTINNWLKSMVKMAKEI